MTGMPPAESGESAAADRIHPFMLEVSGLRGRLVRLGPALDELLGRHAYPGPVAALLGEAVVLGTLLASGLKFDGVFSLQLRGDGPVPLLTMDITSEGKVRAYARFEEEAGLESRAGAAVQDLIGKGYLAFTVDQGPDTDRYQGIVDAQGETLSDCVQHYFRQSEQIDTGISASVKKTGAGWFGAGMAIQRLPDQHPPLAGNQGEDDWRRAMVLMGSVQDSELTDPALPPNTLLFRLFHEDGVRVFTPTPVAVDCRCSRDKIGQVLASLPRDELEELTEDGETRVTCEFCNQTRVFTLDDIAGYRGNG